MLTDTFPGSVRAGQILVGRDGVQIRKDGRSAVFLPQVAPERGWDREQMLGHLCQKAGLASDAWKENARFFTFQANVFSEHEFDKTVRNPFRKNRITVNHGADNIMEEQIRFHSGHTGWKAFGSATRQTEGVVITHPHPLYGGDMDSIIVKDHSGGCRKKDIPPCGSISGAWANSAGVHDEKGGREGRQMSGQHRICMHRA
ncbi:MAG: AMMECR1 domain-containing protein [Desulfobacterales bacterium]